MAIDSRLFCPSSCLLTFFCCENWKLQPFSRTVSPFDSSRAIITLTGAECRDKQFFMLHSALKVPDIRHSPSASGGLEQITHEFGVHQLQRGSQRSFSSLSVSLFLFTSFTSHQHKDAGSLPIIQITSRGPSLCSHVHAVLVNNKLQCNDEFCSHCPILAPSLRSPHLLRCPSTPPKTSPHSTAKT